MALSAKREDVKQVPWFSLTEWHQVYKQVYSNDTVEQTKAYETLLAWKARMPKLPVGVDCTLSIMQVCLRDREWTPKIDNGEIPISYENDLCLMYSTTIMRFLNHISNIGDRGQTTLFQIAKQLNIPDWIVNLRHDAAHGHELPSIGVLRMATNILLTWLHEEYWAAEAKKIEECYINDVVVQEVEESEAVQAFRDLIELWTAVSLYIHANYHLVSDIPDSQLQETLQALRSFAITLSQQKVKDAGNAKDDYSNNIEKDKIYTLETAQIVLLLEISTYLDKDSIPNKEEIIFDALFNTEAFLPNTDMFSIFAQEEKGGNELTNDLLPMSMIKFWKAIIFLLHKKGMMDALIMELLRLVDKEDETRHKKTLASLWLASIIYSFVKLDVAQGILQTLEYQLEIEGKQLPLEILESTVKDETESTYPRLKNVLWFDLSCTLPHCLTDINFFTNLILNVNEFSAKFILPILELSHSRMNEHDKHLLLSLVNIYAQSEYSRDKKDSTDIYKNIFTTDDIRKLYNEPVISMDNGKHQSEQTIDSFMADKKIRNTEWQLAPSSYHWAESPIGILPWQIDSMEVLKPVNVQASNCDAISLESEITPGIINTRDLRTQNQINWNNILRKKRRLKRKHEQRKADIIVNRALENAKRFK